MRDRDLAVGCTVVFIGLAMALFILAVEVAKGVAWIRWALS